MANVLFEKMDKLGVITISRPQFLNVLNIETLKELDCILDNMSKDKSIYSVILTGAGDRAFAAGADISEMKDMNVFEAREFSILGNRVFRKLENLEKPVIAAINGFALGGGCELALSCDLRIASERAKLGQPEVTLGITPGFGATQRLSRLIGISKAKEMIYTGMIMGAEEALKIGLVNRVVPKESLMDEAMSLAAKIGENSPIAVRYSKAAINNVFKCDMETALMYETEAFSQCFETQDQKDAMSAFVEKRKFEGFNNK